jgi:hypothetical protein
MLAACAKALACFFAVLLAWGHGAEAIESPCTACKAVAVRDIPMRVAAALLPAVDRSRLRTAHRAHATGSPNSPAACSASSSGAWMLRRPETH